MNVYTIAATSFGLVMVAMFSLTLMCLGLQQLARKLAARQEPTRTESEPTELLVVLLTAAASEALSAPVQLYSIKLLPVPDAEGWTRAGRMDLMMSHRVERKR